MINEEKDTIIIDFTSLIYTFFRKFWIMLLVGILGLGLGIGYAEYKKQNTLVVPIYYSTAKIYLPEDKTGTLTANFFELMDSIVVLNQVIQDLNLNMSTKQLSQCFSYRMISETSMVYLSAWFPNAELAKAIVDDLLLVNSAYAIEIIGMSPPTVYDAATVSRTAYESITVDAKKYALYGFALSFGLTCIIIMILQITNKKFYTPEQIRDKMAFPVLSVLIKAKKRNEKYYLWALQTLYNRISLESCCKVISFQSITNEEKRTVIIKFAKFLQTLNKKVVILDANLTFANGKNGNSLQKYLLDDTQELNNLLYQEDEIDIFDNEDSVVNAVELLSNGRYDKLLNILKEQYDYILVDVAPSDYAAETNIILCHSDLNLFIVEAGKTKFTLSEKIKSEYEGAKIATGIVLTNVKYKKNRGFKKTFGKYMGFLE